MSPASQPESAAEQPGEPLRLSKLMAQRGLCSRREADEYIARGWVLVDGKVVSELGTKVLPTQGVTLSPQARQKQEARVTILLYKPPGYVSGQPEDNHLPAVSLITEENHMPGDVQPFQRQHLQGLAPAGRLDIDSRGLLIFTQDGRLAKLLTSEDSELEKEYIVRVRGEVTPATLSKLQHGIELDGRPLKPARVERITADRLRFLLREGKHRQIRRMCEAVALDVLSLMRVRIGRVKLGTLPEGQWRFLRTDERF